MTHEIIKFVNELVNANSEESQSRLRTLLKLSNITSLDVEMFSKIIERKACINLHFHPDRLSKDGLIIKGLLESGQYKNQYQTNISSGSLSASNGGDRDNWENELFGNIFKNTNSCNRPKYGSLNLILPIEGASPRFGSCYFITKPEIKNRSTFTYGDSHLLPKQKGTITVFHQILLGIFEISL